MGVEYVRHKTYTNSHTVDLPELDALRGSPSDWREQLLEFLQFLIHGVSSSFRALILPVSACMRISSKQILQLLEDSKQSTKLTRQLKILESAMN